MSEHKKQITGSPSLSEERDDLWRLLSEDARVHPCEESPWFAARVSARASGVPQERGVLAFLPAPLHKVRWILPLPLAGVAAAFILLLQHTSFNAPSRSFSSTESEFEQHMEMFASNDFNL
ncbi:MAG: hypothetical protein WCP60_10785 [bacterium]